MGSCCISAWIMVNVCSLNLSKTMKTSIYVSWSLYDLTDYGSNHSAQQIGMDINTICRHIHGDALVIALILDYFSTCKHRQRPSFNQYLTTVHKHKPNDWQTDLMRTGQEDDWVNNLNGVINKWQWRLSLLFIQF